VDEHAEHGFLKEPAVVLGGGKKPTALVGGGSGLFDRLSRQAMIVWKAMRVRLAGSEWPYHCKTFESKVKRVEALAASPCRL
jgi:hypothetical protein